MKIILPEVANVILVNQRHSYFYILSNFAFFVFVLFFNKILGNNFKSYVGRKGGVTTYVTKRYILVDGVEEIELLDY